MATTSWLPFQNLFAWRFNVQNLVLFSEFRKLRRCAPSRPSSVMKLRALCAPQSEGWARIQNSVSTATDYIYLLKLGVHYSVRFSWLDRVAQLRRPVKVRILLRSQLTSQLSRWALSFCTLEFEELFYSGEMLSFQPPNDSPLSCF